MSVKLCVALFNINWYFSVGEKMYKNIPKDDDVACIQNSHARRIT